MTTVGWIRGCYLFPGTRLRRLMPGQRNRCLLLEKQVRWWNSRFINIYIYIYINTQFPAVIYIYIYIYILWHMSERNKAFWLPYWKHRAILYLIWPSRALISDKCSPPPPPGNTPAISLTLGVVSMTLYIYLHFLMYTNIIPATLMPDIVLISKSTKKVLAILR